jgi:hypothetical protein
MSLIRDEMSLFRAQVNEVHDDIQFVSAKVMPQKSPRGRVAETRRPQVNDDDELRASLEQLRKLVYPGPTHVAHDA